MKTITLIIALLAALSSQPAWAADGNKSVSTTKADAKSTAINPFYKSWSAKPIGTVVTSSMSSLTIDKNKAVHSDVRIEMKLVRVEPAEVTIEIIMVDSAGTRVPSEAKIPSKAEEQWLLKALRLADFSKNIQIKEVGAETVAAGEKEYKCTIMRISGSTETKTIFGKIWLSPDVPQMQVATDITASLKNEKLSVRTESKLESVN